eukprot:11201279-Lingulodinium_polyedra.AAC.1
MRGRKRAGCNLPRRRPQALGAVGPPTLGRAASRAAAVVLSGWLRRDWPSQDRRRPPGGPGPVGILRIG